MSKILKLEYFKLIKEVEKLQKEEEYLKDKQEELRIYNNKTEELISYLEKCIDDGIKVSEIKSIGKEIEKRSSQLDLETRNFIERKETYNNKVAKIKDRVDKFIEKIINTELNETEGYIAEKIFEVVKRYDLLKEHYWDRDKRNEIKKYVLTEGIFNVFTDEEFMILEREIIK